MDMMIDFEKNGFLPEKIVFERNNDGTYHICYTGVDFVCEDGIEKVDIDMPRAKIFMKNKKMETEILYCNQEELIIGVPIIEKLFKDQDENILKCIVQKK